MTRPGFAPEEIAWLRDHYPRHPVHDTARLFRERFGRSVDIRQLTGANARHAFDAALLLSGEQLAWMRANVGTRPLHELRRRFEARFGWPVTRARMGSIVRAYGLHGTPNVGCFPKGHRSWNTGLKGYRAPGSEKGWFRKGQLPARTFPMFSERWAMKHGVRQYLKIKVSEPAPFPSLHRARTGRNSRWIRKAVWVWRQAHGPVPKGHVVIQLNGDKANCDLDNLECVPKSVLARLNAAHAPRGTDAAYKTRVRIAQVRDRTARRRDES